MKFRFISLLSLVCLLGFLYVQSGPFRAAYGIQQCIEQGEAENLERYIDFSSVREATKQQVRSYLAKVNRSAVSDPSMQVLFSGLSMTFTDALIDGFLQAENLSALFASSQEGDGLLSPLLLEAGASSDRRRSFDEMTATLAQVQEWCAMRYLSWSEFEVTVIKQDSLLVGTQVFFERRGIDWVLSSVRFSDIFWRDYLEG
ncbi:MAG: hypothetical protein CML12_00555 [Puniceicoccaceae bacterium]|nr:hypothetical protein [Puniceicoccaceae bacterium]